MCFFTTYQLWHCEAVSTTLSPSELHTVSIRFVKCRRSWGTNHSPLAWGGECANAGGPVNLSTTNLWQTDELGNFPYLRPCCRQCTRRLQSPLSERPWSSDCLFPRWRSCRTSSTARCPCAIVLEAQVHLVVVGIRELHPFRRQLRWIAAVLETHY